MIFVIGIFTCVEPLSFSLSSQSQNTCANTPGYVDVDVAAAASALTILRYTIYNSKRGDFSKLKKQASISFDSFFAARSRDFRSVLRDFYFHGALPSSII